MTRDKRRLMRARLIERVRDVEKRVSADAAQAAVSARVRVEQASDRVAGLVNQYKDPTASASGDELARQFAMSGILRSLSADARADAERSRAIAEARLAALNLAERRRRAAQDQWRELAQAARAAALHAPATDQRRVGTGLE